MRPGCIRRPRSRVASIRACRKRRNSNSRLADNTRRCEALTAAAHTSVLPRYSTTAHRCRMDIGAVQLNDLFLSAMLRRSGTRQWSRKRASAGAFYPDWPNCRISADGNLFALCGRDAGWINDLQSLFWIIHNVLVAAFAQKWNERAHQ